MTYLKFSLAAAAVVFVGSALAQGTPPNPNVANPAMGAGQQTQQGTPMGTTGVPAANSGATGSMPANNMPAATTSNASGQEMAPTRRMRTARADRN